MGGWAKQADHLSGCTGFCVASVGSWKLGQPLSTCMEFADLELGADLKYQKRFFSASETKSAGLLACCWLCV